MVNSEREERIGKCIFLVYDFQPSPVWPQSRVQAGVAVWSQLAGAGGNEYAL